MQRVLETRPDVFSQSLELQRYDSWEAIQPEACLGSNGIKVGSNGIKVENGKRMSVLLFAV